MAAEMLLDDAAERLTERAVALALEGDGVALRLCMERIVPPRRERPLCNVGLPPLQSVTDVPPFLASLVCAVGRGELAPGEATSLAGLVERYVGAVEMVDVERRLQALERARADDGTDDDEGAPSGA